MRHLLPILLAISCCAQTYTARTDVIAQPYPSPLPNWGNLTGAGTLLTPSDFNIPVVRVTDNSTTSVHGAGASFIVDCGGSAETSILSKLDDRLYVCETGQAIHIFSLAWPTITELYGSYTVPSGSGGSANNLWFSRATDPIAYSDSLDGSGNLSIYQYDFTSAVTGPTIGNGKVTKVIDLSTCVAALGGLGSTVYVDDVSVSNDDQTFAVLGSTTAGQGSSGSIYVVSWNRTTGCQYLNTSTGHWFSGATDEGAYSIGDTFTLHNVRMCPGGTWVKVTSTTCLGSCTSGASFYLWQLGTGTFNVAHDATSGGHTACGTSKSVNQVDEGSRQQYWIRTNSSPNTSTILPSQQPTQTNLSAWDQHATWPNVGGDTTPFLSGTYVAYSGGFSGMPATNAWDGEILGVATDGSGTVWRFAHCYDSDQSANFEAADCIGAGDAHYYMWAADDNGAFGNTDGVSTSCTIATNCRVDVLMVKLPQITGAVTGAVTCSGSVTLQ